MENIPMPDLDSIVESLNNEIETERGYASAFYKSLCKEIAAFDKSLDNEHDVGIKLVSFGQTIQFHVAGISYRNPYLITFFGFLDDGSPVELIQNVSQISFVMIKLKRANPEKPKRQIGFFPQD